eukprot:m.177989 g.177989  ORF g.177989 m.177989 type:complete len:182 (-) comp10444_c1_seq6:1506-2051(-)
MCASSYSSAARTPARETMPAAALRLICKCHCLQPHFSPLFLQLPGSTMAAGRPIRRYAAYLASAGRSVQVQRALVVRKRSRLEVESEQMRRVGGADMSDAAIQREVCNSPAQGSGKTGLLQLQRVMVLRLLLRLQGEDAIGRIVSLWSQQPQSALLRLTGENCSGAVQPLWENPEDTASAL